MPFFCSGCKESYVVVSEGNPYCVLLLPWVLSCLPPYWPMNILVSLNLRLIYNLTIK